MFDSWVAAKRSESICQKFPQNWCANLERFFLAGFGLAKCYIGILGDLPFQESTVTGHFVVDVLGSETKDSGICRLVLSGHLGAF